MTEQEPQDLIEANDEAFSDEVRLGNFLIICRAQVWGMRRAL
jgi:hypothetical protein